MPTACATTHCENTPVYALVEGCRHPICAECIYKYEKPRCAMCDKEWEVRRCMFGERERCVVVDTYMGRAVARGATADVFVQGQFSHQVAQRHNIYISPTSMFIDLLAKYGVVCPGGIDAYVKLITDIIVKRHNIGADHSPRHFISGNMICIACAHCVEKVDKKTFVFATVIGENGYYWFRYVNNLLDATAKYDDDSIRSSEEQNGKFTSDLTRKNFHALVDFAWDIANSLLNEAT